MNVFSSNGVSNSFCHFDSLPSFLYFLFTFNTAHAASHHRVMSLLWWRSSAQNVSNLFYHFDSLPSRFLYFLFAFNTAYAASHDRVISALLWLLKASAWNVKNYHLSFCYSRLTLLTQHRCSLFFLLYKITMPVFGITLKKKHCHFNLTFY